MLATDGHRSNGRWTYGKITETSANLADSQNWAPLMSRAGLVLDHAPDLLPQVAAGEIALDAAVRQATEIRDTKKRRAELPDDLGALVDAGQLPEPDMSVVGPFPAADLALQRVAALRGEAVTPKL